MICRYNVERKIIPIYVSREKNSDFAEHGIDSSLKVKCLVSKRIVHFKEKYKNIADFYLQNRSMRQYG